jgi:hypothetical protein
MTRCAAIVLKFRLASSNAFTNTRLLVDEIDKCMQRCGNRQASTMLGHPPHRHKTSLRSPTSLPLSQFDHCCLDKAGWNARFRFWRLRLPSRRAPPRFQWRCADRRRRHRATRSSIQECAASTSLRPPERGAPASVTLKRRPDADLSTFRVLRPVRRGIPCRGHMVISRWPLSVHRGPDLQRISCHGQPNRRAYRES